VRRKADFIGANLLTLFLYSALSGMLFFFPLDLIQVQGYSPTEAGAALLPFILLMFLLGKVQICTVHDLQVELPTSAEFLNTNFEDQALNEKIKASEG
jgi:hypothetical protein